MRTALGYTTAEIDALPFSEYLHLLRYWRKNPPIHLLVKYMFTKK